MPHNAMNQATEGGDVPDRPITVLHVTQSMRTGGLERVVLELTRSAAAAGVRPLVASLEAAGSLAPLVKEAGGEFFLLGKRSGLDPAIPFSLARLAREKGADVLHAHNQGPGLYAGLAGIISRRPVVVTRHGTSRTGPGFAPDPSYRLLSRLVGRLARATVCVGEDSLRVAREVDRIPMARLRLIKNGVDTGRYAPDPGAREATRRAMGWGPEEFVVLFLGRLSPEKNPLGLARAAALLEKKGPGIRAVFVGDGPERATLEEAARTPGQGIPLAIMGERHDIPEMLNAADAFCLPSISEGVSMALLEAMAVGLPVAATRVGGTGEVVRDGQTGYLVEPGDPAALAGSLLRLARDVPAARAMGLAGRERVARLFSLEAAALAYRQAYLEVMGNFPGRRRSRGSS